MKISGGTNPTFFSFGTQKCSKMKRFEQFLLPKDYFKEETTLRIKQKRKRKTSQLSCYFSNIILHAKRNLQCLFLKYYFAQKHSQNVYPKFKEEKATKLFCATGVLINKSSTSKQILKLKKKMRAICFETRKN